MIREAGGGPIRWRDPAAALLRTRRDPDKLTTLDLVAFSAENR
jgi:hypothetical protein